MSSTTKGLSFQEDEFNHDEYDLPFNQRTFTSINQLTVNSINQVDQNMRITFMISIILNSSPFQ